MQVVDGPALELSDIMHTMSPSPAPQLSPSEPTDLPATQIPQEVDGFSLEPTSFIQVQNEDPSPRSSSPDPHDHPEIDTIRFRVHQLGFADPHTIPSSASETERELAEMILRLTSRTAFHPSSSQLALQAETIAELTVQRNLLLQEKVELHARWEAEREGWERSAEALIGKRRVAHDTAEKDYESERLIARLRDDNSALRHKLSDTHARMSALEAELSRLRPLLLMQPSILRDPALLQHPSFLNLSLPEEKIDVKKKRRVRKEKQKEKVKHENGKDAVHVSVTTLMPMPVEPDAEGEADAEGDLDLDVDMDVPVLVEGGTDMPITQPLSAAIHTLTPASYSPAKQEVPQSSAEAESDVFGPSTRSVAPQHTLKFSTAKADEKPEKKSKDRKGRGKPPDERMPLLSDARAECLLVAARKMGRIRAGLIATLMKEKEGREREEREREKEKERVAAEAEATRRAAESEASQRVQSREHATPMRSAQPTEGEWQLGWERYPGPSSFPPYSTNGRMTPPLTSGGLAPVNGPPARRGSRPESSAGTTASYPRPSHLHPSLHSSTSRQPPTSRMTQPPPVAYAMPHPGIVYMHSPIAVGPPGVRVIPGHSPGAPVMVPVTSPWPAPTTPTSKKQTQAQVQGRTPIRNGGASDSAPATPLDSLLSAARTLMVDEDYDGDGDGDKDAPRGAQAEDTPRRRSATAAGLGSPIPKRRKVGSSLTLSEITSPSTSGARTRRQTKAMAQAQQPHNQSDKKGKGKQKETTQVGKGKEPEIAPARVPAGLTRVRSALDVLADQAAQEQERRPSSGPGSRRESAEPEKTQHPATSRQAGVQANEVQNGDVREPSGSLGMNSGEDTVMVPPSDSTRPNSPSPLGAQISSSRVIDSMPAVSPNETGVLKRPPSAPPGPVSMLSRYTTAASPRILPDTARDENIGLYPSTPPSRTRPLRAVTEEPSPRESARQHNDVNSSTSTLSGSPSSVRSVPDSISTVPGWFTRTREIEIIPIGGPTNSDVAASPPSQSLSHKPSEGVVMPERADVEMFRAPEEGITSGIADP